MNKNIIIIFLVMICHYLNAQFHFDIINDTANYSWRQPQYANFVPPGYDQEDAVIVEQNSYIFNREDFSVWTNTELENYLALAGEAPGYKFWKLFPMCIELMERRIKILTPNGLGDWTKIFIPENENQEIVLVCARVIKKNGEVIEMSESDLFRIEEPLGEQNPDHHFGEARFRIPNVEVGDNVEIVYMLKKLQLEGSGTILMNSSLPIMASRFYLVFPKGCNVAHREYNGMRPPQIIRMGDNTCMGWYSRNLDPAKGQILSNPYKEIPCVRYNFTKFAVNVNNNRTVVTKTTARSWKSIFTGFLEKMSMDLRKNKKSKAFYKLMETSLQGYEDSSKWVQMCKFHHDLNQHFLILDNDPDYDGTFYTPGYYVDKGYITIGDLLVAYQVLFKEFGFPHYLAYACDKYKLPVEADFSFRICHKELFYVIYDDKSEPHFVFPSTPNAKYEIDEIPPEYQGVKAIFWDDEIPLALNINLPVNHLNDNHIYCKGTLNFDLTKDNILWDVTTERSGAISTCQRHHIQTLINVNKKEEFINEINKNKNQFILDTFYIKKYDYHYPFKYQVEYEGRQRSLTEKMAQGIYVLHLKDLFYHTSLPSPNLNRTLDYYGLYDYCSDYDYTLVFNLPVELNSSDSIAFTYENELGTYELRADQRDGTHVYVQSNLTIKHAYLPKDKFHYLLELEDAVKKANNIILMFQILD